MGESIAVLLLNAEGDKFSASYLTEGARGGKLAAEHVYALAREKTKGSSTKLIVYLVSDGHDNAIGSGQTKAFLRGFASTENSCFVVEPLRQANGLPSASARILQLLKLYVPLKTVSTILLGSLHNAHLYGYLRALPTTDQAKITLVSTISVAPPYRVLVDGNSFVAWRGLEGLFGGLSLPDLTTLSVKEVAQARIDEVEEVKEETVEEDNDINQNEQSLEMAAPSSPEEFQQFLWDSSPSDETEEESDEWEVAGRKKPPRPTSPGNNLDADGVSQLMDPNNAQVRERSGTRPRERGGRDRRGLSTTSGASRRRKQRERERGRRDQGRRSSRVEPRKEQGLISPLPAWDPPRIILHEPHPCVHHYLRPEGCQTHNCPYSHNYEWASEWEEKVGYRLFVKSKLCVKFVHGKCSKGEDCLMAHRCHSDLKSCRHGPRCYFLTQGLPHSSPV
ncbi:uncharacterized protein JCM6883_005692 [Sporobolomyces salmoneus]|uniref:uncharacterized protein n=1 Tax=Sporobolomyces salmoneus TaxID=183962 RepID=UPI00316FB23B